MKMSKLKLLFSVAFLGLVFISAQASAQQTSDGAQAATTDTSATT
ncbi:hypothetical protein ACVI1L_003699 [Bradyrhizobium sp. USDA 4516]